MTLGRWSWIGHGCKIRVHEGEFSIGAKSVMGQECTISAYQHISIGRECIIADRVMMIDFDHGMVEVERPIREQGIYKRDVDIGHNVWIGYGACLLRGVSVGDNAVIGTSAVVTADVPANAVVGGVPARLIRMRKAPETVPLGIAPGPARESEPGGRFLEPAGQAPLMNRCRAAVHVGHERRQHRRTPARHVVPPGNAW